MPRGRFGGMSISELQSMLQQRRSELNKPRKDIPELQPSRQARLPDRIARRRRGERRPRRTLPTKKKASPRRWPRSLEKAGKPMAVGDIMQKVQSAGYRSSSANFRGIVNQTLIKDKQFTSSVRCGMYQLKK